MGGAFLHKKSLLDQFKDDYKVSNPIKARRTERQWGNPIVRHKREKGVQDWAKSFAGKRHYRKLMRFNAMRNEGMKELPTEVAKIVWGADFATRPRDFMIDVDDKGYAVDVWPTRGDQYLNPSWRILAAPRVIVTYETDLQGNANVVAEQPYKDVEDIKLFFLKAFEEGVDAKSEAFNAKEFYKFFDKLLDRLLDVYDEGTVSAIVDSYPVTDMWDKGMTVDEIVDDVKGWYKAQMGEAHTEKTAWTYLNELEQLEGKESRKEATKQILKAAEYKPGTEGRWYDKDGEEIDVIDVLDNTEWAFAQKVCGQLQESRELEVASVPFAKGQSIEGTVKFWFTDDGRNSISGVHDADCAQLRANIWDIAGKRGFVCRIEPVEVGRNYYNVRDAVKTAVRKALALEQGEEFKKSEGVANIPKFVQINTQRDFDKYIKPALGKGADAYGLSDIEGMWWEIADGERAPASAKTMREIHDSVSKRPRFIFINGVGAERGITDLPLTEYAEEMGMTVKEYLNGYDAGSWESKKSEDSLDDFDNRRRVSPSSKYITFSGLARGDVRDDVRRVLCKSGILDPQLGAPGDPVRFEFGVRNNPRSVRKALAALLELGERNTWYIKYSDGDSEHNRITMYSPDIPNDMWYAGDVDKIVSYIMPVKSEAANETLSYEKGHKNSRGEDAPWVIRDHKGGKVLASFAKKADAEAHLERMQRYSKSESLKKALHESRAKKLEKIGSPKRKTMGEIVFEPVVNFKPQQYAVYEIDNDGDELECIFSGTPGGAKKKLGDAIDADPNKKFHVVAIAYTPRGQLADSEVVWSDLKRELAP